MFRLSPKPEVHNSSPSSTAIGEDDPPQNCSLKGYIEDDYNSHYDIWSVLSGPLQAYQLPCPLGQPLLRLAHVEVVFFQQELCSAQEKSSSK